MRIATGGISHESSTLISTPTTRRDFEGGYGLYRGQEILEHFRDTNICTGGFIDAAKEHGFELVPLLWTFAYPSGRVTSEAYQELKDELLERLRAAENDGPIDGVLLDLHGAMVIEDIDDGDGDLIAAVREAVGPGRPIGVTQDLHGNHTQKRAAAADVLVGFDTYPHVDQRERGREAAHLIVATIRGEIQPAMHICNLPLLWSAACQVTAHPPMKEAIAQVHAMESRDGILSATLATGFPFADVPDLGASVIVVADGSPQLARSAAEELADWVWERRETWYQEPPSIKEALAAGDKIGNYPVILADSADNTGGGSPGDSTEVLRTFLELQLNDALLLYMVDPAVAEQAHAAGRGATIEVMLGGKSAPAQGPPVTGTFEVVALTNGQFAYDGPMFAGLNGDMGQSAWLRQDGVSVVVVTEREQPFDTAFTRTLGLDCQKMRYIAVKSSAHFRSGFESIAGSIFNIAAAGVHSSDPRQLRPQTPSRPLFPIASDATR